MGAFKEEYWCKRPEKLWRYRYSTLYGCIRKIAMTFHGVLGITLDPKLLGLRIRQARERIGMSQEDLAAFVSRDQKAISEYENGRRKLAATDLPTFATVLEVPLTFFFEEEPDVYTLDDALLNYFHRLPSTEARRSAVDILRIFYQSLQVHRSQEND